MWRRSAHGGDALGPGAGRARHRQRIVQRVPPRLLAQGRTGRRMRRPRRSGLCRAPARCPARRRGSTAAAGRPASRPGPPELPAGPGSAVPQAVPFHPVGWMEFRALQGGMVTTQVNEGTGVNMPGIIVGVDGSAHSQWALEWGMSEAASRHAPLTALAVRHRSPASYAEDGLNLDRVVERCRRLWIRLSVTGPGRSCPSS